MTVSSSDMKDLTLSSKWSITLHDPSSPHLPCITLGQFNTIFGFWQIYNAIVEKKIIQTLPTRVNITIYRENTQEKPNAINQWHGEWNVELHHQTNPLKIYQKIVLLVIGEQLTNKIRGLVLHRVPVEGGKLNFSISIFTDQKDPDIDVKNILLSNDVIDLNYCITKMATFHPFQIIHIPMEPSSNSEHKESEEIDDNIPYVKYSMDSLLQYSKLMEHSPAPRQNDFGLQINNNNDSRMLQDFKYRDCVLRLFGKHAQSYNLGIISNVSDKLQEILIAEGCVVCMQTSLESPYNKKDDKPCEEEKSDSIDSPDDSPKNASFVIAQCPSLGCQHVIHSKCILNAGDNIVIRGNHCSDFFKTIDLSKLTHVQIQREIGYHIDTNNRTGKTYQFSFKLNHLISNKNQVSPQWPITIPSYFRVRNQDEAKDNKDKEECLQIFFDHTELQMSRGTIQIAIVDQNTDDKKPKKQTDSKEEQKGNEFDEYANSTDGMFIHRANFEIPVPLKDVDTKVSNKIYQLRYTDSVTHNALIINLIMKLKPNYAVQLLSLRYEFNSSGVSKTDRDRVSVLSSSISCDHPDFVSSAETAGTVSTLEALPVGSIITLNDQTLNTDHSETDLHPFSVCPSPSIPLNTQLSTDSCISASSLPPTVVSSVPLSVPLSLPLPIPLTPLLVSNSMSNTTSNMNGPTLYPNVNMGNIGSINNNHSSININTINHNIIMLQQQQQQQQQQQSQPPQPPPPPPQPTPNQSLISSNLYLFENIASKFDNPSQLYQYACSPLGSHYIATKIRYPAYFTMFFDKLKTCFPSLMVNCNGHTVCRAIYSQTHCTLSDKIVLLESLIPNFSSIASNRQGSFALICIMSLMSTNSEIEIISKAFVSIMQCNDAESHDNSTQFDDVILSQSGYHVIKKFIGFGYPHFNCILNAISADFTKYATHHYGVPIIRSILDTISANRHLIKEYSRFLQLFAQHTHSLVCDQFGNYVIQQLMEISPHFVTDTIKEFMVLKYSEYSKHKFASNVVEKCLKHTLLEYKEKAGVKDTKTATKMNDDDNNNNNNEQKEAEINDLSDTDHSEERRNWSNVIIRELLYDAKSLINHKYGNYCLQTALSVCIESKSYINDGGTLLKEFVETTQPLLHLLRLNVRKKWQQLLMAATHMENNNIFIDSHNYYEAY